LLLLAVTASYGQSLPEVARQQRLKQQAKDAQAARRVITNEDVPSRTESAGNSSKEVTDDDKPQVASAKPPSVSSGKSAAQWKAEIKAQEDAIASLQDEVAKLSAAVHFVRATRYNNGVQYNQSQAKKQEEVERLRKQLDGEKQKLADMQESCRKAGFGNAVYEPK
jgi:hypothetical protein